MITLSGIKKEYQVEEHIVLALNDVSFKLGSQGFISIVGPSGCGKTTLLNMLGGLDHPTEGNIEIDGFKTVDFDDQKWNIYRNQEVGFVFQSFYLIPHLSVLENVMLPLKLAGIPLEEQNKRALDALKSVGLEEHINHKPNQLSGGQQQRSAIARALINQPSLILADEPTGSLDHASSVEVMNILKKISEDHLVVMVSHNEKLAQTYSDRIIQMDDGKIKSDTFIQDRNQTKIKSLSNDHEAKMSFMTAFRLSISNLKKRLYRTMLMVLAASIGVLGMTLVLAVSSGFDRFLEQRKIETLNAFPIRVERVSAVVPFFDEKYQPNLPLFSDEQIAYPRNIQYEFTTINTLTPAYYTHVQGLDENLYDHIFYNFGTTHTFVTINDGTPYHAENTFDELPVDQAYLNQYFDLLYGRLPNDDASEMVIIVDRYNRLSKEIVQKLGYSGDETLSFEDLLALSIKWLPHEMTHTFDGTYYDSINPLSVYTNEGTEDIDIVGVVRIKDTFNLDLLQSGFYYTQYLGNMMRAYEANSAMVLAQLSSSSSIYDGTTLTSNDKEILLREIGYSTYPTGYTIYSKSFEDKDVILRYLKSYNDNVSINYAVEPLDIAGIGLSTMRVAIDSMTIILLVFSGISLLISNVMIGIMTYTSVIERTREIGILRAIGARKKDVGRIFISETCVIGFLSGLAGVIISYAMMPLFNIILEGLTTIPNLTYLSLYIGLILILVNTLLTSLFGIIPARIASKKDPIMCLRNE